MNVLKIPFVEFVGIEKSDKTNYILKIEDKAEYQNHIGTVHAGMLFVLAEATSGEFLLHKFKSYYLNVIPVVRRVEVKYSKPGKGNIYSSANFVETTTDEIVETLTNTKRAIVKVKVELFDESETKIMIAFFEWFISILE